MNLKDYKKEKMKDPAFAKPYEKNQPEMNVIHTKVEARPSQNLTQKQLAEKTRIALSIENALQNRAEVKDPDRTIFSRSCNPWRMPSENQTARNAISFQAPHRTPQT